MYHKKKIYIQQMFMDLDRMRMNWMRSYGKDIEGWLLGPNEYMSMRFWLGNPNSPGFIGGYRLATEGEMRFQGKPIRLKRSPGIELEIMPEYAAMLAHGDESECGIEMVMEDDINSSE